MSTTSSLQKFFDHGEQMSDEDYADLQPLVKKGQDRETVLSEIIDKWLTPSNHAGTDREAVDAHVAADGFVLKRVAFIDENTNEPINMAELLGPIGDRLRNNGEPIEFRPRPDLFILIKDCHITHCNCREVKIRPRFVAYRTKFGDGARFDSATFSDGAIFDFVRFGKGACFAVATFGTRALFEEAIFADGADFRYCRFARGALFSHARLPNADLRTMTGFIPDETYTRGAHFSARARDPWSRLRAAYTGPRLIYNLLFLTLFFVPFIARTAGYYATGHAQEQTLEVIESVDERLVANEADHPELVPFLREQLDAAREHLPDRQRTDDERWRETQVWRMVIGFDRGMMFWLPAVLILIYNIGRGAMTYIVAPMRDAEERSGITPALSSQSWSVSQLEYCHARRINAKTAHGSWRVVAITLAWLQGHLESYGWLIGPHRVLRILMFIAIASFLWNAAVWLSMPVWLPA